MTFHRLSLHYQLQLVQTFEQKWVLSSTQKTFFLGVPLVGPGRQERSGVSVVNPRRKGSDFEYVSHSKVRPTSGTVVGGGQRIVDSRKRSLDHSIRLGFRGVSRRTTLRFPRSLVCREGTQSLLPLDPKFQRFLRSGIRHT